MAATLIGTTGNWGIASAEAGMLIESLDFDFKCKEKPVLNEGGETVGLSLYDQVCEIAIKGLMNGFTGEIAAALTIANTIPSHIASTDGRIVTKNIKRSLAQEDFDKIEIAAALHNLIPAAA